MCEEYNGWTNRETWATKLWLDNDEGFYSAVNEMVKEIVDSNELEDFSAAKREIAGELEEFINELFDFESLFSNRELFTMLSDIGSLYRVNWWEIAETLYIEYTETPEFVERLDEANAL